MIELEIIFDPAPRRFYIVAIDTDTNQQHKISMDEEIFAEYHVHKKLRKQMAAEIARIGELLKEESPPPSSG